MRSINRIPLETFVNWWGIDPWRANGIDLTGELVNQRKQSDSKNCFCMLQHPYQAKDQFSRDDLIEMLKFGEAVFIDEAGYYPVPTQVLLENKQYDSKTGFKQYKTGLYKSIEPIFNYQIKEFGYRYLESMNTVLLVRDDIGDGTGNILQQFSGSFPVQDMIDLKKIHLYFLESDGRDIETPNIEDDYDWEVRPIRFKLNGNNIEFIAPAYLFKKPELDEEDNCVLHEFDTYVTSVEIFYERIDKCQQGNFICENYNCQHDCESQKWPVCFNLRKVGKGKNGVPYPKGCNANGDYVDYCLNCLPNEVEYNYITGMEINNRFLVDDETQKAIFLLSICLYDCIKEWCVCDICPRKKVEYYRTPELVKIENAAKNSAMGDRYEHYITDETKGYIKGLPPYRGLAEAFTIISRIGNRQLEGTFL